MTQLLCQFLKNYFFDTKVVSKILKIFFWHKNFLMLIILIFKVFKNLTERFCFIRSFPVMDKPMFIENWNRFKLPALVSWQKPAITANKLGCSFLGFRTFIFLTSFSVCGENYFHKPQPSLLAKRYSWSAPWKVERFSKIDTMKKVI